MDTTINLGIFGKAKAWPTTKPGLGKIHRTIPREHLATPSRFQTRAPVSDSACIYLRAILQRLTIIERMMQPRNAVRRPAMQSHFWGFIYGSIGC